MRAETLARHPLDVDPIARLLRRLIGMGWEVTRIGTGQQSERVARLELIAEQRSRLGRAHWLRRPRAAVRRRQPECRVTTVEPLRPDIARELIALAAQSAGARPQPVLNQLDAVQLGQDRHADHADTKVLRRILAEHDWPGHRLVGPDAARAAWSLALHADDEPDFQRAATTLLERAVQTDDARIQHWAHLHDRALVNSGRPQEFGTQQVLTRNRG